MLSLGASGVTAVGGFKQDCTTTLLISTAAGLEAEARQELRRLLPGAEVRSLLLKGNIVVEAALPEDQALAKIRETETQLVARVVPVQGRVSVSADPGCFTAVAGAAATVRRIGPGESFLVRCHRRGQHGWTSGELERSVAHMLEEATQAIGDYESATDWLVSVEVYQDLAYVGVNRPADLLHKKLGRQRKYRPGERPLNRAQWKLREAMATFGVQLPPEARALDLGSAPGGWAAILSELAAEVVAVDPADLHATVAARPNVQHLRCRAEELGDRGDWSQTFDLITCDMNIDPAEAASILCQLARLLKPGAPAIMSVKYPTRARRRHEREARAILTSEYEHIEMRRLPHNARETTAFIRRKGGSGGAPN